MRKGLAAILLTIHLFNLVGYCILFRYLSQQSSNELIRSIDKNDFIESELLEVKMKLNLPYLASMSEYERFDGNIEIAGKHNKYVKRKISNDTLYLLCLPDKVQDQLKDSESKFASGVNDFDAEDNQGKGVRKTAIFNQFHTAVTDYNMVPPLAGHKKFNSFYATINPQYIPGLESKPPKVNS